MIKTKIPKVFKIIPAEDVERICPIEPYNYEDFLFDGRPRKTIWERIHVEIVHRDSGRVFVPGDLPASSVGDLVLNRKAKDKIGSFLEQYGELLPLSCECGEFWTLNITCIIDALNEDRSDVMRSKDPGRLLMIHKYSFRPDALVQAVIFRIPQLKRSWFATDVFVELIKSSGLTGVNFKQIWAPD